MNVLKLSRLIALCKATSKHFEYAVYLTDNVSLKEIFMDSVVQRGTLSFELKDFLRKEGKAPIEKKSVSSFIYRALMVLKATFNGNQTQHLLKQCEMAEKRLIKAYDLAVIQSEGNDVLHNLLKAHIQLIESNSLSLQKHLSTKVFSQEIA